MTASTIYATDFNAAPLTIARRRNYPRKNSHFAHADAFALGQIDRVFDAAFVGFWWSHMLLGDTARFLRGLSNRLRSGSTIAILDNRYVEGSNYPIVRVDSEGNTYQRRSLPDGSEYDVLKNFPTVGELHAAVTPYGVNSDITELDYYWLLTFNTR